MSVKLEALDATRLMMMKSVGGRHGGVPETVQEGKRAIFLATSEDSTLPA